MDQSQFNCARKRSCDENVAVFTPPPVHQTTFKSVSSPDLPYDVIFEILPRLPVKSVLRFKCICKSLETLISDPKFTKQHLSHSNRQIVVPSIITKFANKIFTEYRVLGSCNGLLCIYNMSEGHVRLFNPCTRLRSKISPNIPVGVIISSGFGYDHVNDKYKVLITAHCFIKIVTQIYTFGEKSWKTIKHFPFIPLRRSLSSATFVSGTFNWLIRRYDGIAANQFMILSFDLEKETYGELLLPEHDDGYENCEPAMDVDVLTKCLRVCLKYNKTHWAMWRLNEYGNVESWTKLTIIPEDQKFWQINWLDQFRTSNQGSGSVVNLDSEIVLYDSISDDTGYGFYYPKRWRDRQYYYPYTYEESLVSPP